MARPQLGAPPVRSTDGARLGDLTGSLTDALGILRAGLGVRTAQPCRVVFAGSSTVAGFAATVEARRFVNLLVAELQRRYPSGAGTETAVITSDTADWGTLSTAPGVHGYNAALSGSTSNSYLDATDLSRIAAINPRMVLHMPAANDYNAGINPATTRSNVLAKITALQQQTAGPCVHVLVHSYPRPDVTAPTYPWAEYAKALAALAAADPNRVAFLDLSQPYILTGLPGADPLGLIADTVHQTDGGHALMADLLLQGLLGSTKFGVTTTQSAPTPLTLTATPGDGQVTISASGGAGATSYALYRGTSPTGTPIATSLPFTDTGRPNGTAVSYVATASNAAGTVTSPVATATPTAANQTVLVADTFNRADTTGLGAADSGQTWTTSGSSWAIAGNRATAGLHALIPTGAQDQDVSVDFAYIASATTGTAGISLCAADTNNRLTLYFDRAAGMWRLAKLDAGTLTVLQSGTAPTLSGEANHTLRCVSKGATLTAYVDGAQVTTYTLSSAEQTKYKATGYTQAGLRASVASSGYFDNFTVKAAA